MVGAASNCDTDRPGQIRRVFEMAREFDVAIDMHLDSGASAEELDTLLVCDLTEKYGWAGASPSARQQARLHAPPGYGQGGATAGRFRHGADGAFKRGRRTVTRELVRLHRP